MQTQSEVTSSKTQTILIAVALLVLCLPAIQPFTLGELNLSADGILHLYRTVVLDHSLHIDGALYPRYSSSLVYGYGAPLWNYFPPTAYYPSVILHAFGLSYLGAFLWSFAFYTLVAAGGAFLLGRIWGGNIAGFGTALAYVYAPYFLFNTVSRGTITEAAALALLPYALWALTRLAWHGRRIDLLSAVGFYALFFLMHNIITLHGTALIAAYCLFLTFTAKQKKRVFSQLLIAGVLSILLTAFFWLPALGETDFVRIDGVTQNLSTVDVTTHLRSLSEIFASPFTADTSQFAQAVPISLGWGQLIFGLLGLFILRRKSEHRSLQIFLLVILAGLVFLNTPESAWLWQNIPLIGYTQFAWRTLGIASLVLALMAGLALAGWLELLIRRNRKIAVFSGFSVIIALLGMSWLYSLYLPDISPQRVLDAQDYERQTGQLALSSFSEYLPVWTQTPPDPQKLADQFVGDDVVSRLNSSDGVMVESAEWHGTSAELMLQVDQPMMLIFDWLFVPGWQVTITDLDSRESQNLSVSPTSPQGLVSIEMPAGNYDLRIALLPTDLQNLSHGISFVGLILLVIVAVLGWRFVWREDTDYLPTQRFFITGVQTDFAISLLLILGTGLFLFKALVLDHIDTPIRTERFSGGFLADVPAQLNINFNNEIVLIGAEAFDSTEIDEQKEIVLYWRLAGEKIDVDYSSIVELKDSQGNVIADASSFTPGGTATSNWLPGYYVIERINFQIPPFTPPTQHTLEIGLFSADSGTRLDVINEAGNPDGVSAVLNEMQITKSVRFEYYLGGGQEPYPRTDLSDLDLTFMGNDEIAFSPETLVDDLPTEAEVGEELQFSILWLARGDVDQSQEIRLSWIVDDEVKGSTRFVDPVVEHPTRFWLTNDIYMGHQRLYIPANLNSGTYKIALQIERTPYNISTHILPDFEMQISVPVHIFDLPDGQFLLGEKWTNGIELVGYEISDESLILHWRTDTPIYNSLRLFVHLLDDEQIVAQSVGVPVDWTRPTTGWVMGEIITTMHQLGDLTGKFQIRVGWYDPQDGARVPLENGDNSLILP